MIYFWRLDQSTYSARPKLINSLQLIAIFFQIADRGQPCCSIQTNVLYVPGEKEYLVSFIFTFIFHDSFYTNTLTHLCKSKSSTFLGRAPAWSGELYQMVWTGTVQTDLNHSN